MPDLDDTLALTDELGSDIIDLSDNETTLMARIPLLAGSNKKVAYLAYRSCGFTITQSCDLADIHISTVHKWRKIDATFKRFEEEELRTLQESVGNDVIKFEFLRNMRLLLKSDMKIIAQGVNSVETLTEREFELFKNLRKFYTPHDLLALEKVLHPEKHNTGPVKITLTWGGRLSTSEPDIELSEGDYRELPPGKESADMS